MKSNTLYTIYILWLRQLKRYVRSRSRIIGSLAQPLLFLVALGFGFGPVFEKAGGGNYIQFLAPGIVAMSILFTAVFSGIEILWDRQFGFLKETLVAPVSRVTIMIGRTLGGATVASIQGAVVLIITLIAGFRPDIALVIPALIFMFAIALVFTALGTAIACLMEDMQGFGLVVNILIMPAFFLSGAIFPLDTAPTLIRYIAYINPLSYGVDGLRMTLAQIPGFGYSIDIIVLAAVMALFVSIGAWLFTKIKV